MYVIFSECPVTHHGTMLQVQLLEKNLLLQNLGFLSLYHMYRNFEFSLSTFMELAVFPALIC